MIYSSIDEPYLAPLIKRFREKTGINVRLVTDAEASKTAGLAEKIEAEKAATPADQPVATRSKKAPAPAKKESWLKSYLSSREGRSLINKLFNLAVQMFTKRRR